ncbi:MAG: peptidyl-prolyl cis-trans isomerase [Planctomycetes bacterium]|nr:peptidyl-prolyl cis-trans isomerase [Planctomycetota bacterium]
MRRLACLLILVSAASSQGDATTKPAGKKPGADPTRVYESGIAALVNREVITIAEVREAMRVSAVGMSEAARRELFERTLAVMILDRVMDQAAARLQLVLNPQHILAHVERQKSELGGEESYREYLMERGTSHEEYVTDLTLRSQRHLYVSAFAGGSRGVGDTLRPEHSVDPTAREVRAYYEDHLKDDFSNVSQADIWYMAITVGSTASRIERGTKAKALEKAKRIKAELVTGADFATLARLHSPITAETGGHSGWHDRGSSLLKPIIDYAFEGEVGTVSDPIEFGAGWLLVRCAERKEAHVVPFAVAQRTITAKIREERLDRARASVEARIVRESYIYPVKYKLGLIASLEARRRGLTP